MWPVICAPNLVVIPSPLPLPASSFPPSLSTPSSPPLQAVLYVLCFHMRAFSRPAQQSKQQAHTLTALLRLLTSHLQPLKVSSPGCVSGTKELWL